MAKTKIIKENHTKWLYRILVLNTLNNEIWFIQKQNTSYYSQLVVVKLFKFFAYPKYISVTLLYSNYLRSGIPFRHSSKRFSNSNL